MKRKMCLFCMVVVFMFSLAVPVFADASGTVTTSASGWILASDAPAGAKIINEKWTYDQKTYMESQSSSVSGWFLENSYWKQTNSGSFNYAAFPSSSYYSTGDSYYKSYQKSAYSFYETTTAKRVASNKANGYIFYHFAYPDSYSDGDNLIGDYYAEWGPAYTTQATIWESFYSTNPGTVSSHRDSEGKRIVYKFPGHSTHSYWWFRLDVRQCSYTDYVKIFKYYITENKESSVAVTASENITNVKHWVQVESSAVKFADVPNNSWYAAYVNDLVAQGILNGRTSSIFDPEGNITRAEFAKILAVASGDSLSPYAGSSVFSDCTNHWAKQYINWASAKGIVSGVGNGKFAPDDKITREALCTMVWRYAKYKGIYPAKTTSSITFNDDSSISYWAKDAVYIMQRAGILAGKGNNCFDPKGNAKRNECAKVICCYQTCKNDTAAGNNIKILRSKFAGYGSGYNFFLADLTHDGVDDLVVTYYKNQSSDTMQIDVYTVENGTTKKIYNDMIGTSHMYNGGYYLMQKQEGAYLVYHHDSVYGGIVCNILEVYHFTSNGSKQYLCDHKAEYDSAGPNPTSPTKYYYEVKNLAKSYESQSTLLADMEIWTENGETPPHTKAPFAQVFGNLGK